MTHIQGTIARCSSRRRITAWAGAGVLAATLGVGAAGAAEAAPASAPVQTTASARGAERARPQAGFTAVRRFGTISADGTPVAMTAPARDVVFVLSEGAGGKAEVQRITTRTHRGKTTTSATRYRLGTPLGDPGRATIDGTSASDVWATAGGKVFRFDGRRFTEVALPKGEVAVTVADAPGSGVYVGTETQGEGGEVWRGTVGRRGTSWTSTGRAVREGYEDFGLPILNLRVVEGRVFGMWMQPYSANIGRAVYELDSGTWKQRYLANTLHPSGGITDYTWLTPKAGRHVILGRYETPRDDVSPVLTTSSWNGGEIGEIGEMKECRRGGAQEWVSEKGALLADGRLVTAGFTVSANACTTPRALVGNAGEQTLAMTTARGTNTAWALTRSGDVVTLQRYVG